VQPLKPPVISCVLLSLISSCGTSADCGQSLQSAAHDPSCADRHTARISFVIFAMRLSGVETGLTGLTKLTKLINDFNPIAADVVLNNNYELGEVDGQLDLVNSTQLQAGLSR